MKERDEMYNSWWVPETTANPSVVRGGEAVSTLVSIGGVVLFFLALGYAHGFDSSEGEYILIGSYCVIVVIALSLQTLLPAWEEKEA